MHANAIYVCVLNEKGEILLHHNLKTQPKVFVDAVAPYRDDLAVVARTVRCNAVILFMATS